MTDLTRPVARRTYRDQAGFVVMSAVALVLAWGILRFVIPGRVQ